MQVVLARGLGRLRRSSLFPYTTLFRSPRRVEAGHAVAQGQPAAGHDETGVALGDGHGQAGRDRGPAATRRQQDRKSTRLNSSHLVISYAVLCVKTEAITPIVTNEENKA